MAKLKPARSEAAVCDDDFLAAVSSSGLTHSTAGSVPVHEEDSKSLSCIAARQLALLPSFPGATLFNRQPVTQDPVVIPVTNIGERLVLLRDAIWISLALNMRMCVRRQQRDLAKGLVAGIAGGLLASFLMEQFQSLWTSTARKLNLQQDDIESKEDPATVKAAQAISTSMVHRKIRKKHKAAAGEIMHYLMGGSSGAIYGMAAELTPVATAGEGLVFGTIVWAAADNAVVPALGFAKPPAKTPMSTHVYALGSHFVYGFVTEAIRQAIRAAI